MKKTLKKIFGASCSQATTTLDFLKFSLFWAFCGSCFATLVHQLFFHGVAAKGLSITYLFNAFILIVFSSVFLYLLTIQPSEKPLQIILFALGVCAIFFALSAFFEASLLATAIGVAGYIAVVYPGKPNPIIITFIVCFHRYFL